MVRSPPPGEPVSCGGCSKRDRVGPLEALVPGSDWAVPAFGTRAGSDAAAEVGRRRIATESAADSSYLNGSPPPVHWPRRRSRVSHRPLA
jgi:hypothetical protein